MCQKIDVKYHRCPGSVQDTCPECMWSHQCWAHKYKGFSENDWKKVIRSYECYVYLGDDRGHIYVTCCPHEELLKKCLILIFKQSTVCIMVWGSIMKGKKGPLIVLRFQGWNGTQVQKLLHHFFNHWYSFPSIAFFIMLCFVVLSYLYILKSLLGHVLGRNLPTGCFWMTSLDFLTALLHGLPNERIASQSKMVLHVRSCKMHDRFGWGLVCWKLIGFRNTLRKATDGTH
jgi:hypothetical protein